MSFAPDADFKGAMRRLTTTVNVVTAVHEGNWVGMTATAVTSVCADPATILVCINSTASIHQPIRASGRFCVNLLRVGQEDVSHAFSGRLKGSERFAVGDWVVDDEGLPYLSDAQASLFCRTEKMLEFGTHGIFIGSVFGVRLQEAIYPLLYQDGRYARSQYLAEA